MIFSKKQVFEALIYLSSDKTGDNRVFDERKECFGKKLHPRFDLLKNMLQEEHIDLFWRAFCGAIKSRLDEMKAVIIPNFLTIYPGMISLCQDFMEVYKVKSIDNEANDNILSMMQKVEVPVISLSLQTKLSKEVVKFILSEVAFVVGTVIAENQRILNLDFGSIGKLTSENQFVRFQFSKDYASFELTTAESSTSLNTFNPIGKAESAQIYLSGSNHLDSSAEALQPSFFKRVSTSERRIQGPSNQLALELAYEKQRELLRRRSNALRTEDEGIRQLQMIADEKEMNKQRRRRRNLKLLKKFHQDQMLQNMSHRQDEVSEQKREGIFVDEQMLPMWAFGSMKGSSKKKNLVRSIAPFPMEKRKTIEDWKDFKQQKKTIYNDLSQQLEEKTNFKVQREKTDLFMEKKLNAVASVMSFKEEEITRRRLREQQHSLRREWDRQISLSSLNRSLQNLDMRQNSLEEDYQ